MRNFRIGDEVVVTLVDGTMLQGYILKIGPDRILIDENVIFGDWVSLEFINIINISIVA